MEDEILYVELQPRGERCARYANNHAIEIWNDLVKNGEIKEITKQMYCYAIEVNCTCKNNEVKFSFYNDYFLKTNKNIIEFYNVLTKETIIEELPFWNNIQNIEMEEVKDMDWLVKIVFKDSTTLLNNEAITIFNRINPFNHSFNKTLLYNDDNKTFTYSFQNKIKGSALNFELYLKESYVMYYLDNNIDKWFSINKTIPLISEDMLDTLDTLNKHQNEESKGTYYYFHTETDEKEVKLKEQLKTIKTRNAILTKQEKAKDKLIEELNERVATLTYAESQYEIQKKQIAQLNNDLFKQSALIDAKDTLISKNEDKITSLTKELNRANSELEIKQSYLEQELDKSKVLASKNNEKDNIITQMELEIEYYKSKEYIDSKFEERRKFIADISNKEFDKAVENWDII